MEPLKNKFLKTGFIICAMLFISCNETKKEEFVAIEQETPMLEVASQEYADLAQKTLDLISEFDLETWKDYLADDVVWYWPDGDSETRHSIKGKEELIAWWKNWKETTDGQISFTNNTFLPIKVNTPSNYYMLVGTGVLTYTDLTISIQGKSTSVRQHMVFMFDENKKINHALLYYDRTGIIELTNVVFGATE
jgi:ketosteroid isomerase-like protein